MQKIQKTEKCKQINVILQSKNTNFKTVFLESKKTLYFYKKTRKGKLNIFCFVYNIHLSGGRRRCGSGGDLLHLTRHTHSCSFLIFTDNFYYYFYTMLMLNADKFGSMLKKKFPTFSRGAEVRN